MSSSLSRGRATIQIMDGADTIDKVAGGFRPAGENLASLRHRTNPAALCTPHNLLRAARLDRTGPGR
jgi:hypothetical protein